MSTFALDMERFANLARARIERVTRIFAMKLFSAVIKSTPVLTGRLVANWQTTIGAPAVGTLPAPPEGAGAASVRAATTNGMVAVVTNFKGDGKLVMINNLPYARRIEFEGWSHTKAPAGMVRVNLVRMVRLLQDAIRDGKV